MRVLIATLVAAVLLVSGCASSSGGAAAGKGNGTVKTIKVAVKGGKVVPSAHREKVPQGDTVRLVVTTDTADEVHVHGYDLKKDVAAGKTGTSSSSPTSRACLRSSSRRPACSCYSSRCDDCISRGLGVVDPIAPIPRVRASRSTAVTRPVGRDPQISPPIAGSLMLSSPFSRWPA